jgi:hypothetical protein
MRWLPSRHRFALSRLIAFVISSRRKAHPPHTIYTIDHDQSAAEAHTASAIYLIATICYIAALLPFSLPVAIVVALPLTMIAMQIPIYLSGAVFLPTWQNKLAWHSLMMMTLLLAASAYIGSLDSWARYVAWSVLTLFFLNALAAAVMLALRDQVRALEQRCAG